MAVRGALLRIVQTLLRAIQLLAAILVLGVFSYYLAVLSNHNLHIATWIKAVEGMAGAALLYTAFAVILTICLGGISFFALLAIVLDICFIGCFAAIAVLTRGGTDNCSGYVHTPLGDGPANQQSASNNVQHTAYTGNLGRACKLEKAVFAVSILNAVLFLITAGVQYFLARTHKREKRYGPSPANNYTSGVGRRSFWKRKNRGMARDTEMGAVGAGGLVTEKNHNMRPSHETGYTGTTVDGGVNGYGPAHTTGGTYPTYTQPRAATPTPANF